MSETPKTGLKNWPPKKSLQEEDKKYITTPEELEAFDVQGRREVQSLKDEARDKEQDPIVFTKTDDERIKNIILNTKAKNVSKERLQKVAAKVDSLELEGHFTGPNAEVHKKVATDLAHSFSVLEDGKKATNKFSKDLALQRIKGRIISEDKTLAKPKNQKKLEDLATQAYADELDQFEARSNQWEKNRDKVAGTSTDSLREHNYHSRIANAMDSGDTEEADRLEKKAVEKNLVSEIEEKEAKDLFSKKAEKKREMAKITDQIAMLSEVHNEKGFFKKIVNRSGKKEIKNLQEKKAELIAERNSLFLEGLEKSGSVLDISMMERLGRRVEHIQQAEKINSAWEGGKVQKMGQWYSRKTPVQKALIAAGLGVTAAAAFAPGVTAFGLGAVGVSRFSGFFAGMAGGIVGKEATEGLYGLVSRGKGRQRKRDAILGDSFEHKQLNDFQTGDLVKQFYTNKEKTRKSQRNKKIAGMTGAITMAFMLGSEARGDVQQHLEGEEMFGEVEGFENLKKMWSGIGNMLDQENLKPGSTGLEAKSDLAFRPPTAEDVSTETVIPEAKGEKPDITHVVVDDGAVADEVKRVTTVSETKTEKVTSIPEAKVEKPDIAHVVKDRDTLSDILSDKLAFADNKMWGSKGVIATLEKLSDKDLAAFGLDRDDLSTGLDIGDKIDVEKIKVFLENEGFAVGYDQRVLDAMPDTGASDPGATEKTPTSFSGEDTRATGILESKNIDYMDSRVLSKMVAEKPEMVRAFSEHRIVKGESLSDAILKNIFKSEILGDKFDSLSKGQSDRFIIKILNDISADVETDGKDSIFGFKNRVNINHTEQLQNVNLLEIIKRAEILLDKDKNGFLGVKPEGVWSRDRITGTTETNRIMKNLAGEDDNTQRAYRELLGYKEQNLQNANAGKTVMDQNTGRTIPATSAAEKIQIVDSNGTKWYGSTESEALQRAQAHYKSHSDNAISGREAYAKYQQSPHREYQPQPRQAEMVGRQFVERSKVSIVSEQFNNTGYEKVGNSSIKLVGNRILIDADKVDAETRKIIFENSNMDYSQNSYNRIYKRLSEIKASSYPATNEGYQKAIEAAKRINGQQLVSENSENNEIFTSGQR